MKDELVNANELLERIRKDLLQLSEGDAERLFAYGRKIAKMSVHDERSWPNERRKLKAKNTIEQHGPCAMCSEIRLPSYDVPDRLTVIEGYTTENTRSICET